MLTPDSCRAARDRVGMTRHELARRSGVSHAAIQNFEGGKCQPRPKNLALLQLALEVAGVDFGND